MEKRNRVRLISSIFSSEGPLQRWPREQRLEGCEEVSRVVSGEACVRQREEQVQRQSLAWLEQAVRKGEEWAMRLDQQ